MDKRKKNMFRFWNLSWLRFHETFNNKCMRQAANREHSVAILTGVLDKQVLLSCLSLCCNISLCVTWQGHVTCSVLELTVLKDKVVCLPSECGNRFTKSFLQTCLWHIGRPQLYTKVHSFALYIYIYGDRGGTVFEVMCYKSEGRWFDSRWCHWNFSLT